MTSSHKTSPAPAPAPGSRPSTIVLILAALIGVVFVGVAIWALQPPPKASPGLENKINAQGKTIAAMMSADKVAKYAQCQQGYAAIVKFNTLMDLLAEEQQGIVDRASPTPRPNQAHRARIYRDAMSEMPPATLCGKPPPGAPTEATAPMTPSPTATQ